MSEALPENWKQTAARPTVRIAWIGGVLHQWYEFVWGGEGEWRKVETVELPNDEIVNLLDRLCRAEKMLAELSASGDVGRAVDEALEILKGGTK